MNALAALAARVAEAGGWRRWLLAWLLGAVAAAALPPVSFTLALLVSFPGLVWLLDGARDWRGAARDGWWFGFGFLTTGLYWVSNALLTDAAQFGWLVPFAVLGLPAAVALFPAAGAVVAKLLWVPGPLRVLALAAGWSAGEAMRGHWFTGFPWNLVGYTWTWSAPVLQTASVIGVYGLSFATAFVAASLAALAEPGAARRHPRAVWAPALATGLVLVAGAAGWARLQDAPVESVPGVLLRVVQANIAQPDKWDPDRIESNLRLHLDLSARLGAAPVTHVVWPETAATFFLDVQPEALARLSGIVPPGGVLLTGAPRAALGADGTISQIWNSIRAVDDTGAIVATYDKAHLVPFGEYVPFRRFLGAVGLGTIVPGNVDYSAGPGPRTMALPGLPPVSPLVCYEAIFPGGVVDREARPGWLLNATNDGWYGRSAGPYQHFEMARVRAVEQGLPLVRAANTGISGVIDSWGRVRARLALGETGVVDAPLPLALPPTLYSRYGFAIPATLLFAGFAGLIAARARRN